MRLSPFLFALVIPALLTQEAPGPAPGAGAGAGGTGQTNPGLGGGGNTMPTNPGLGGTNPTNPGRQPFPGQDPTDRGRFPDTMQNRPIFLSGKVILEDGTPPPDSVVIERVCNGVVRPEGYTNSKGNFSFELGRNNAVMADASTGGGLDDGLFGRAGGGRNNTLGGFGAPGSGVSERDLMGCEIRANLAGFRSQPVMLSGRRFLDNPDIGTIILRRIANVEGFTFSMTTALAPKEAKKSYDKGLDLIKKKKFPEALAEIEKATAAYPKYAIAWYDQGRLYEMQKRPADAQRAYEAAIAADAKYVKPYLNLSYIYAGDKNWAKSAEVSAKGIKLNPFEYPQLHYVNAVSNVNLGKLDDAEKSAREAEKLGPKDGDQRVAQLLSFISTQKSGINEPKVRVSEPEKGPSAPPPPPPPPPAPTVSARTSWPSWSGGISDLPPGTLSKSLEGQALWKEVGGAVYSLVTAGDATQLKPEAGEFQGAAVAVTASLLVTNCDVLENQGSTGLYQNGKLVTRTVRLIKSKRAAGLCVLEAGGARLQPVNGVRYAQDLSAGEKTYTVRNGALAEGTLQSAKVQNNMKLLVSNAPVSAATAGGGLFDGMGNLIGITTLRSQTAVIAVEEYFQ